MKPLLCNLILELAYLLEGFYSEDKSMKFHRMYIKERAQMKGQFMKIGFSLGTKKRKTEQTNGLK